MFPNFISYLRKDAGNEVWGKPHQKAAFYKEVGKNTGCLAAAEQLHGKELSYNNINDTNGALELLKEFDMPTVVAVKHANPCG